MTATQSPAVVPADPATAGHTLGEGVDAAVTAEPAGRRLCCPYCGDDFTADLQYRPLSYSEHRDLVGYECDNWECDARWKSNGDVERLPKSLRAPS